MRFILIITLIIIVVYGWYIAIVRRRNQVQESLSGVDVQLTKRHDLISNILIIASKFMEHEKSLFAEVTALRSKISSNYSHENKEAIADYFNSCNELAEKMANLMLQVENYPALKSDQAMLQAQISYNEVEENISAARRFYNASVAELNNITQIFPGNIIAKLVGQVVFPFYQASEVQKQVIDASSFLK